jgi:hypothetical protein
MLDETLKDVPAILAFLTAFRSESHKDVYVHAAIATEYIDEN